MNEHFDDIDTSGDAGDARLLWQLRGLRRDATPGNDLWPGIAARIGQAPARAPRRAATRVLPWALAASVLLATGLAWKLQPDHHGAVHSASSRRMDAMLLHREADAMTREYEAALLELRAGGHTGTLDPVAARDLDRSAAQIRAAMARDPGARFLLDRLRSTYAQRLALAQRSILT